VLLWGGRATATITQGDFSIYGNFKTQESGRWGESGARNGPSPIVGGQVAPRETGGSFDFEHWDLVQMRQTADLRPDYKIIKNYNLLGRLDSFFIQDADIFADYRAWYDAFPDLKEKGRAPAAKQWNFRKYTERAKTEWYRRNDLREYYAQFDVTDSLTFRIGKQQVIWSEADALSGTEVINPSDLRFHWTHFENPEDLRRGVQMAKVNYQIPDFMGIANNIFEGFVIPGDDQGGQVLINVQDPREPYVAYANAAEINGVTATPTSAGMGPIWNSQGLPVYTETFADTPAFPVVVVPAGATVNGVLRMLNPGLGVLPAATGPLFFDYNVMGHRLTKSKSIKNSDFGARYSWLLPIGNGLQMSFIYLFIQRFDNAQLDPRFTPSAPFYMGANGANAVPIAGDTGTFIVPSQSWQTVPGGLPFCGISNLTALPTSLGACRLGTVAVLVEDAVRRTHLFGITGTYYDKDLTDIVFRYDFSYRPQYPMGVSNGFGEANVSTMDHDFNPRHPTGQMWKEQAIFIFAFDRPTYIPWISKQHTFLIAQNTLNWYPDRPKHAVLDFGVAMQKLREYQDLFFVSAVTWLMDGRWTSLNAFVWDIDDTVGEMFTVNSFRYNANILLGVNVQWYLGRSGRHTDPFLFSHDQRMNEVELRATYEL
jgi:hypothetical protein